MTTLPTRTTSDTDAAHVGDHNTLHTHFNSVRSDRAIRYVAADGSDSNDGFSWGSPMLTIQEAYDSLPSSSPKGGTIHVGPGRFDVGTGLVFDQLKAVELIGQNPRRQWSTTGNETWSEGGTVLTRAPNSYVSSNLTQRNIVGFGTEDPSLIGGGFVFRDLIFELRDPAVAGITAAIHCWCVNHMLVENCAGFSKNSQGVFVHHDSSINQGRNQLDASWGRIVSCYVQNGALYRTQTGGYANDGWVIDKCVNFADSNFQLSSIYTDVSTRMRIRDTDIHWSNSSIFAIDMRSAWMPEITGISGENTTKLINLRSGSYGGCHGGYINVMGRSETASTVNDIAVQLDAAGGVYTVLPYVYTWAAGAQPYRDNTSTKANWCMTTTGPDKGDGRDVFWLPHLKRGTGSPEGVVYGRVGDHYQRSDGGAGTALYVKETGDNTTTGWQPK